MRIAIKIGTLVLTAQEGTLNHAMIEQLSSQIATLMKDHEVVLVSSGAVASGREVITSSQKDPVIAKRVYAAVGQARLIHSYQEAFTKHGIIVAQALLERNNFSNRTDYLHTRETLEELITQDVLPIINENDVVADREIRFGDNDELAALVAITLQAHLFIIGSMIDGLFTANPKKDSGATLVPVVETFSEEIMKMIDDSANMFTLGGMSSKLNSAKLATRAGIETWIVNGTKKDILLDAVAGKPVGTRFVAEKIHLKGTERWLSGGALSLGQIHIDAGALQALQNGKSLLCVGIRSVQGNFSAKDIVDIIDEYGREIAVGKTNYGSADLEKALTNHTPITKEVIHRDYIVLLE